MTPHLDLSYFPSLPHQICDLWENVNRAKGPQEQGCSVKFGKGFNEKFHCYFIFTYQILPEWALAKLVFSISCLVLQTSCFVSRPRRTGRATRIAQLMAQQIGTAGKKEAIWNGLCNAERLLKELISKVMQRTAKLFLMQVEHAEIAQLCIRSGRFCYWFLIL